MRGIHNSILIISSEFPPNVGGIGNHSYNLAKSLSADGYKVTVLADVICVNATNRQDFISQQNFSVRYVPRRKIVLLSYIHRIANAIRLSFKNQVIICSGKFSLWLAILIRLISSKKLIAVVHGSELDIKTSFARRLTNYALTKFNHIISVSSYTRSYLPALPSSIKQTIIHNGVNLQEFDNAAKSVLKGTPALITLGSVTRRKGQENVIKALPLIKEHFPNFHYHIIGKPDLKTELQQLSAALNVTDAVTFYGAVNRNYLLNTLSSASIKLMLSNHTTDGDFEGFGIAVLEANALGIPVIGSKNSGIEDAIVHEKTGFLVDPKSPEEILNAIKSILKNYSFFSLNALHWAKEHDWKMIVKQYEEVLDQ